MSDAGARGEQATATASAVDPVVTVVREILSGIPAGCSWLLPVTSDGQVVDFRIEATSGRGPDIYGRGVSRVGARLSELYPSMVGGPLWQLYQQVMVTGQPGQLPDFRYEEKRAGVIAESLFDVSVHRVLGGLLVCWQRLDDDQRRMEKAELLGSLGWAEYDLVYCITPAPTTTPARWPSASCPDRSQIRPDPHHGPSGPAEMDTSSQMRSTIANPRPRTASDDGIGRPNARIEPWSTTYRGADGPRAIAPAQTKARTAARSPADGPAISARAGGRRSTDAAARRRR